MLKAYWKIYQYCLIMYLICYGVKVTSSMLTAIINGMKMKKIKKQKAKVDEVRCRKGEIIGVFAD